MSLTLIKNNAFSKLIDSGIPTSEAEIEISLLIEHVFGLTKKDMIINPHIDLPEEKLQEFNTLINRRITEKIPVQFLINKVWFMGEEFYVDENVLIPRPETEILVEETIRHCNKPARIIDIGTGSGCIAIMLAKKLPDTKITAVDISEKALEVAKFNAKKHKVDNRIKFVLSDLFENINCENFDIIVSNPPYIPIKDKETLQDEVKKHEPPIALFVEDEKGLSFYEKLVKQSVNMLNSGGFLAVEVGIYQAGEVRRLFEENGFEKIQIIRDLGGIDRVVTGEL